MTTTTAAEALEEVPISDERLAELIADYQHFIYYQDPDDEDGRLVLSAIRELQHRRAALSGQAEPVSEEREECARMCEAAGHDERLADGGLYLRAARLLRAPQQQAEPENGRERLLQLLERSQGAEADLAAMLIRAERAEAEREVYSKEPKG